MPDDPEDGSRGDASSDESTTTGELRIDAPEARVAAGLSSEAESDAERTTSAPSENFELPNWADPPTGQVPRVLLEQSDVTSEPSGEIRRGPTWRQESEDFGTEEDLSFLIPDEGADESIAGRQAPTERPFEFNFDPEGDLEPAEPPEASDRGDEAAWTELFTPEHATSHSGSPGRRRHSARHQRRPAPVPAGRSARASILTGILLGALALACFGVGRIPTLVLVILGTTLAAGEAFAVLQGVGYRPATLIGLGSVPALELGAYFGGAVGLVSAAGLVFVVQSLWFLGRHSGGEPLVNLSVTTLITTWVGAGGAFAALALAPASHPHGRGVALVLGVVLLVVANDVGAYGVGAKLGRHRLAPSISPGKSVEGLIGGTVLCLVLAAAVVSRLHPFHLGTALGLGAIVAVLAPIGDLLESRVKRDLGVKDMGSILPAHGGIFDRIDAMLFVLPVAYVFFRAVHFL